MQSLAGHCHSYPGSLELCLHRLRSDKYVASETFENLTNTISERNHFKGLPVEIRDKSKIELDDPNSLFDKILQGTSSLYLVIHGDSFCWWLSHWDEGIFATLVNCL